MINRSLLLCHLLLTVGGCLEHHLKTDSDVAFGSVGKSVLID